MSNAYPGLSATPVFGSHPGYGKLEYEIEAPDWILKRVKGTLTNADAVVLDAGSKTLEVVDIIVCNTDGVNAHTFNVNLVADGETVGTSNLIYSSVSVAANGTVEKLSGLSPIALAEKDKIYMKADANSVLNYVVVFKEKIHQ